QQEDTKNAKEAAKKGAQKVLNKKVQVIGGTVFSIGAEGRSQLGKINRGLAKLRQGLISEGDSELIELFNKSTFLYSDTTYDNGSEISQAHANYKTSTVTFFKDFGSDTSSSRFEALTVFHEFRHLQTDNYNLHTSRDFILGSDAPFEQDARSWAAQFEYRNNLYYRKK
ncbi:hypothetical protein, partial [Microbulbifer sp. 2205BS26-8]|uniref:hypothetical protein n=1 Tax=Microbulbifer sp. 2205BS26-8 TaxID=3064386 RepID=UPI00273E99A5